MVLDFGILAALDYKQFQYMYHYQRERTKPLYRGRTIDLEQATSEMILINGNLIYTPFDYIL